MKKILFLLLVCASLCACHTTRTVEVVAQTAHDTLYLNKLQYDSIFIDNAHYIDRSSDTLYIRDVSVQYKYKLLRDTIYKSKTDSIPVIKTVEVTKEVRYIPWYAKVLSWLGAIFLILLIVYVAYRLVKLYLKKGI